MCVILVKALPGCVEDIIKSLVGSAWMYLQCVCAYVYVRTYMYVRICTYCYCCNLADCSCCREQAALILSMNGSITSHLLNLRLSSPSSVLDVNDSDSKFGVSLDSTAFVLPTIASHHARKSCSRPVSSPCSHSSTTSLIPRNNCGIWHSNTIFTRTSMNDKNT